MENTSSNPSLSQLHTKPHPSFFERFPSARWLIVFSVILLFVSGGTYVASLVKLPKAPVEEKEIEQASIIETITPTTGVVPSVNPTGNWKTYTNTIATFSIKYPSATLEATVVTQGGQSRTATPTDDNTVLVFPGNNLKNGHDFLLEIFPYTGTLTDLPTAPKSVRKYAYEASYVSTQYSKDFKVREYETIWYKKVRIGEDTPRFEIYMAVNGHALIFHSNTGITEQDMESYLKTFTVTKVQIPASISPILPVGPVQTGSEEVICTQDAKVCPDGSYVSRSGPNCEFAACP